MTNLAKTDGGSLSKTQEGKRGLSFEIGIGVQPLSVTAALILAYFASGKGGAHPFLGAGNNRMAARALFFP